MNAYKNRYIMWSWVMVEMFREDGTLGTNVQRGWYIKVKNSA